MMMYLWRIATILLFSMAAMHTARAQEPAIAVPDFDGWPRYEVVKILTPDTYLIAYGDGVMAIRSIGIETSPDIQSYNLLNDYLNGQEVFLEPDDHTTGFHVDEYGRIYAHVWCCAGETLLSLEMIRQGYGSVMNGATFRSDYMSAMVYWQQVAMDDELGQWKPKQVINVDTLKMTDLEVGINTLSISTPQDDESSESSNETVDDVDTEPRILDVRWNLVEKLNGVFYYSFEIKFSAKMGSPPYDFVIRFYSQTGDYVAGQKGSVSFKNSPTPEYEGFVECIGRIKDYEITEATID